MVVTPKDHRRKHHGKIILLLLSSALRIFRAPNLIPAFGAVIIKHNHNFTLSLKHLRNGNLATAQNTSRFRLFLFGAKHRQCNLFHGSINPQLIKVILLFRISLISSNTCCQYKEYF